MKFQHPTRLTAGVVTAALSFGVSANADEAGEKLLKQVIAKYKSMKTLYAMTITRNSFGGTSAVCTETLELEKPNLFAVEIHTIKKRAGGIKVEADRQPAIIVSNGKQGLTYLLEENTFRHETNRDIYRRSPIMSLFYAPEQFADKSQWSDGFINKGAPATAEYRITGNETLFFVPCRILEMTFSYYEKPSIVTKIRKIHFYVDKDNLVRCIIASTTNAPDDPNVFQTVETVRAMQTDIKLPDADFKFTPPIGAKREK